jgi:hypothetical protein
MVTKFDNPEFAETRSPGQLLPVQQVGSAYENARKSGATCFSSGVGVLLRNRFQWGWCVAPESVLPLVPVHPPDGTRRGHGQPSVAPRDCRRALSAPNALLLSAGVRLVDQQAGLTFITKSGAGVGRGEPAPVRTEGHARNWAPAFMPMKHLGERGVAVQQGEGRGSRFRHRRDTDALGGEKQSQIRFRFATLARGEGGRTPLRTPVKALHTVKFDTFVPLTVVKEAALLVRQCRLTPQLIDERPPPSTRPTLRRAAMHSSGVPGTSSGRGVGR